MSDGGKGSGRRPGNITDARWQAIDWGAKLNAPAPVVELTRCASHQDGDCVHAQCPQLRDQEPETSGRSCPLWNWNSDDES